MPRRSRDQLTPDLFDWRPAEPLVPTYPAGLVRAASLRARLARAVSVTLGDAGRDRAGIAAAMSAWLGEECSRNMLDAYASEAREERTIPYLRLLALVQVTGDARALQLGAELSGHAVVDGGVLPWIEVGQLAELRRRIDSRYVAARRAAKAGGRR